MPIDLAKGTPGTSCDRCGNADLPNCRIVDTTEDPYVTTLCVLCAAEMVDVPTGWNNVANVLMWLRRGDAIQRFQNPQQQTRRSRHRKLAPAALRRPRFEEESRDDRQPPADPAPARQRQPQRPARPDADPG